MITVEVFVGALLSFVVIGAGAVYWIMSEFRALRTENRATRQENREDNRATREEVRIQSQRILESLYFHRHDADGAAVFYPPTPSPPATPAA